MATYTHIRPYPLTQSPQDIDTWLRDLRTEVGRIQDLNWTNINFTGSNITDIATRKHSNLQGLNADGYNHIGDQDVLNLAELTGGATTDLHSHVSVFHSMQFVSKTSDYTVSLSDDIIAVDATAGNVQITLPVIGATKKEYTITKTDSSAHLVTVIVSGGATISGSSSAILNSVHESISVMPSGSTNYFISASHLYGADVLGV